MMIIVSLSLNREPVHGSAGLGEGHFDSNTFPIKICSGSY